jgi:CrcB protein
MTGHRPAYLQWKNLGVVVGGGTLGTAIRELVSLIVPSIGGLPVAVFAINLLGAFALGILLEALARRGPDEGRCRTLRLLLGTGVLGGFTTYSALATDTAVLLVDGRTAAALSYSLASVILGALSTWAGIAVAASAHRRRERRPSESEVAR